MDTTLIKTLLDLDEEPKCGEIYSFCCEGDLEECNKIEECYRMVALIVNGRFSPEAILPQGGEIELYEIKDPKKIQKSDAKKMLEEDIAQLKLEINTPSTATNKNIKIQGLTNITIFIEEHLGERPDMKKFVAKKKKKNKRIRT